MAVMSETQSSRLQLVFENGVDGKGEPVYKTKSFNNVKTQATDEQLYEVAVALEPLQQQLWHSIERNDNAVIYSI
ncbi:DUF1659 domain-containing protein [Thalassobacillus hwangdonensis]|uniref:DUF1659 domain-containing protein n=1 Tax=Thalassobacillus hwangdonensis TaxID=546108 RepID=A0ABW3KWQ2_9BACI